MRRFMILAGGALVGGGFYLLLIDTTSLPELYVLAGVALLCGAGLLLAREEGLIEAQIVPRWLAAIWRLAWKIFTDIGVLCVEAVIQVGDRRPARGTFRTTRFAASQATPEATGRRALAEWLGSLAPNTIVIGVDAERELLLVHQLRRQGSDEQLDVLRLG